MPEGQKNDQTDLMRFRPKIAENSRVRATRFLDLCKSCGECVVKCPVKAISWDTKELGMLGEPAIFIDLDKCIGCELCEQICPDQAITITPLQPGKTVAAGGPPDPIIEVEIK